MTTEDRLRDALHAEAARIEPRDGWNAIESRFGETPLQTNRFRVLSIAAAAALVLVAAVAVLAQQDNDKPRPVITNPGTTSPTTAAPVAPARKDIWPIDDSARYTTPEAMATAFAHEFLGVADATVAFHLSSGPSGYGSVDVVSSVGTVITTLDVEQEADDSWVALSAHNDHLVIDNPLKGDTITSPQRITGSSIAFEGTVHVTLYGYGGDATHPLLTTSTFTGHGTELGPFETTITWPPTPDTWCLLMLWTDSARDGSLAEATVRLVSLA